MSKKIENSQQMEEEEDDAFDFALSWINKDSEAKKSVQTVFEDAGETPESRPTRLGVGASYLSHQKAMEVHEKTAFTKSLEKDLKRQKAKKIEKEETLALQKAEMEKTEEENDQKGAKPKALKTARGLKDDILIEQGKQDLKKEKRKRLREEKKAREAEKKIKAEKSEEVTDKKEEKKEDEEKKEEQSTKKPWKKTKKRSKQKNIRKDTRTLEQKPSYLKVLTKEEAQSGVKGGRVDAEGRPISFKKKNKHPKKNQVKKPSTSEE
eukprot:TRINITY_DN23529_c0_g1_i1.p1 TRINITY_DN23529_c0_g1~~TRINITY_DN23529_c0_g1_i1.p1  ORF type:complete len:265 (-),score=101.11 TRINITY_DN23529_c0_g1_i1:12-806(-)